MYYPRSQTILKDKAGIYHCRSTCVRRAFLCGKDPLTQRNFDHRKGWVEQRLKYLCRYFLIEITNFSIQSNHYHLVAKTNPLGVKEWTAEEVVRRWKELHPDKRQANGCTEVLSEEALREYLRDEVRVEKWRERLGRLSELMGMLNEWVARKANKEDECTGRFWNGRFGCSRIEDEGGLLTCMAYVELNSVHNKSAATPEESDHSSIQLRIRAHQAQRKLESLRRGGTRVCKEIWEGLREESGLADWLCPVEKTFAGWNKLEGGLSLEGYLRMVDHAGRCMRDDKPGYISDEHGEILKRLDLEVSNWVNAVGEFGHQFHRVVGSRDSLREAARKMGVRWLWGMKLRVQMYRDK